METDNYDENGFNNSNFKRTPTQNSQEHGQDGDRPKLNEKADEYMRELLSEKIKINNAKFPFISKLIDQEITRVQQSGRIPRIDSKYVDVYREKPIKVTVKVLVPIKEHPKFNFIGQLLGPKGNTMKFLQEETMCKMAVLGRGSMRDRQKEEELRNSLDPKHSHLADELHVEITAMAPPAEAHARIAYALAEVKKYLIPDTNNMMQPPPPRRDLMDGRGQRLPIPQPRMPPRMPPPPMPQMRGAPKAKVHSILDRARSAMETSYVYDDPYGAPEPPRAGVHRPAETEFYYGGSGAAAGDRFYEDDYYKEDQREFKASARDVGTRRPVRRQQPYTRPQQPYARPPQPYQRPK